jgi:hypothetical protein
MLPVFVILDPVTIIKPRTSGVKHTIFYLMLIDELRSCSSLAVLGLCHALLRGIVVSLNTWKDQYKQMHLLCLLLNIDFFCESEYLVLVMHIHKSQQTIDTTNKQGDNRHKMRYTTGLDGTVLSNYI